LVQPKAISEALSELFIRGGETVTPEGTQCSKEVGGPGEFIALEEGREFVEVLGRRELTYRLMNLRKGVRDVR
jgi:hypothetical protein